MQDDRLYRWLDAATNERQLAFMRWVAPILWIVMAVDLIQRFEAGNFVSAISAIGMLCCMSAVIVGPQCWGIIQAAPGSNSRKALTLIVLLGSMVLISGLFARILI